MKMPNFTPRQRPTLQPGQESVWDYPRPPRVEPVSERIHIVFNGITIADSTHAYRVLETSHPPVYYIPQSDLQMTYIQPTDGRSFCEFKGKASYWKVIAGDRICDRAAWSYATPLPGYEVIRDHLAFYAGLMDACYVGDEQVQPQEGDFYGGWITSNIIGPFKGAPGTMGW
jgi:uncharacterized protein (DUF427 family)